MNLILIAMPTVLNYLLKVLMEVVTVCIQITIKQDNLEKLVEISVFLLLLIVFFNKN